MKRESNNSDAPLRGIYVCYLKRSMDIMLSLIAILLLAPLLLLIAILVKIKLGSPVLFKQERPGLNEKKFPMYKFRTMTEERDPCGVLLADHLRHTKFGKLLRSTSLDELPQLYNILKGDMSVVGPRPIILEDLLRCENTRKRRREVRPGLSGLAQINGRNAISWEEKFSLDRQYMDSINFTKDWKIIFLTVQKVLIREGINQVEQEKDF